MIKKEEFLKLSIEKFHQFGSNSFTMDELAKELGISKKTIYQLFGNKNELVSESVKFYLKKIEGEINQVIEQKKSEPLICIVSIYKIGFAQMKKISSPFLFELRKYHPTANQIFEDFRTEIIHKTIFNLLKKSQELGQIRPNINIQLCCKLYFYLVDIMLFTKINLYKDYTNTQLLEHLIIHNLKGLLTQSQLSQQNFDI
ncbi:TetR/AcrR family transcriptional regulator [Abyssalbus ytuae]|uniref:TetR/AcrR family transcriptional regulator n=1 Tax=Abyssalbus ytuae TaxID=2926907 RepID=A0A9E7D3F1_9FLAO|nr:TetR/AcrR family transcriptional regulator [Abyssalbus ytuae]UOB19238.1 TetR/AcrR family transcriptional regulator [Abyssalbus ytuae]